MQLQCSKILAFSVGDYQMERTMITWSVDHAYAPELMNLTYASFRNVYLIQRVGIF